jgi:predicted dehydrogenase
MAGLRGALIGCGFFAINQMHGWNDAEDVEIVAICDRDPARLKSVGEMFGVTRRYSDAATMLAEGDIDFIDVATTVASHCELVLLAARHKLPVICQKPFAINLVEAQAMVDACQKAGVPLMVHENFRWQSPIRAVRSIIDGGEIGQPFWGRFSFRSGYDVYTSQPYLAEGSRFIIEDLGIHILDIARFLMGDATRLTARTRRINPAIQGEDVATILIDHVNDATSVVDVSYASRLAIEPFPETFIEIDGTEGSLRLGQGYELEVTGAEGSRKLDVSPLLLPWASRPWHNIQESVALIQAHWSDCLRQGREPETSGRDNLKTLAMVEAAYQSAAACETVDLTGTMS